MEDKKYTALKDMPKYFPFFTINSLRHFIFENKNNIRDCIVRPGKKIYFDIEKFQKWLESQKWE